MRYNRLRQQLLEEKARLEKKLKKEPVPFLQNSLKESVQELSPIDNHPSDLGAETFERAKDLSLQEHMRIRLQEVNASLEKMQNGSYGFCESCGRQIPLLRLQADPAVSNCLFCQLELEKEKAGVENRPVEEEMLKSMLPGQIVAGDPGYDGEDSWQDVARYGSAEGPQDVPGASGFPPYEDKEERGAVEEVEKIGRRRKR